MDHGAGFGFDEVVRAQLEVQSRVRVAVFDRVVDVLVATRVGGFRGRMLLGWRVALLLLAVGMLLLVVLRLLAVALLRRVALRTSVSS